MNPGFPEYEAGVLLTRQREKSELRDAPGVITGAEKREELIEADHVIKQAGRIENTTSHGWYAVCPSV
jgi:hypothetical protein